MPACFVLFFFFFTRSQMFTKARYHKAACFTGGFHLCVSSYVTKTSIPCLKAQQTSRKPLCSRIQSITDGTQPASIHQRSHADFQQLAIWPHMSELTSHIAQIMNSHSKRLMNSRPQITHANDPGITSVCEQWTQLQLLAQLATEPQSPCEITCMWKPQRDRAVITGFQAIKTREMHTNLIRKSNANLAKKIGK